MQDDRTTLVCLFHHEDQARAAVHDLIRAGIPESSVSTIGGDGSGVDALDKSELASFGMPDNDYDHLKQGIRDGGIVVSVQAEGEDVSTVESIFGKHRAEKIEEVESTAQTNLTDDAFPVATAPRAAAQPFAADATVPVIDEDLVVGKRTVDQGGVRLYRRVIEIPVEESVQLREEHVSVDRVPVDRAVTDADLPFQNRTIELTETAEQVVVQKEARVVEEVLIEKVASEHTETVRDTVRHTEVDIEELPASGTPANDRGTSKEV